jgi:hypothetical protein
LKNGKNWERKRRKKWGEKKRKKSRKIPRPNFTPHKFISCVFYTIIL